MTPYTNDTLPDLPRVLDMVPVCKSSTSGNTQMDTTLALEPSEISTVNLISPPAVQRRDSLPRISKTNAPTNLGDLLCTLNFDIQINKENDLNDTHARKVTTTPTENTPEQTITTLETQLTLSPKDDVITSRGTRTVVTDILLDDDTATTTSTTTTLKPLERTRQVVTVPSTPTAITPTPTPPETARQVVTVSSTESVPQPHSTKEDRSTCEQSKTNDELNALLVEDDSNQTRASSNLISTPRSVVTDPDAAELETANTLLQLGSPSDSGSKHQDQLEADYDNSDLLPVDAAPLEDFARELAKNDMESNKNSNTDQANETIDSTDSDKTVDYMPKGSLEELVTSPKGSLKYKQYGIKRPSPKTGPNRNQRCPYCDVVCHSKRDWNIHHKTEHTKVQCPDCHKLFPTPDAMNRHRYVHNEAHKLRCEICDKICAFQSDLDQHMSKHSEDKKWFCSYDDCTRDFKRKSDLTAHEVVHTGEDFMCEFPDCDFKRKDLRLVKRHQRVHTREAKVECPVCGEKFVFYMQMKRHREKVH